MRREARELPSAFSPEDLFDVELNDDVRALLGEESPADRIRSGDIPAALLADLAVSSSAARCVPLPGGQQETRAHSA